MLKYFTSDVHNNKNDFRTRVFAATFGYLEDPATGSGNSAFGYYLLDSEMWKKDILRIEQNGLKDNYNLVRLKRQIEKKDKTRVCFGGGAITKIDGEYCLY